MQEILEKYKNIVFRTAEFIASYAHWQEKNNRGSSRIFHPMKTRG